MSKKIIFTDNSIDNETQVKNKYFIDYSNYCEVQLTTPQDDDGYCYRCGKPLIPLTYLEPDFYHLPCWDCSGKKKIDRETNTNIVLRSIKDYYNKIVGDRYFQLFIVDDIYCRSSFPHTYATFKKILNTMTPPSRNDFWFLDWEPGYPKTISTENINGLKIVNLTDKYSEVDYVKDRVKVGDYEVLLPEFVPFESHHHSRYSILNKNGDRKSKRLKLGDKCLKLYNTEDPDTKAIFKLLKNGEEIPLRNISHQDYVVLKLAIMRNKTYLKLIFDVINELCGSIGILRDSIFLKNTICINPKLENQISIVWSSLSEYKNPGNINISIL